MKKLTMKQLRGMADFKESNRGHQLLDKWDKTHEPIAIFEANYIYFKIVTGFENAEAEQMLAKIHESKKYRWPMNYKYKAKWLAYFIVLMDEQKISPPLTYGKQNKQLAALSEYFNTPRLKTYYYEAIDEITQEKRFVDEILPLLKKVTFRKA